MRHKSLSEQTDEKYKHYNLKMFEMISFSQTIELLPKVSKAFLHKYNTSEGS